ncbi:protein NPAT isoform 2-T2 [Leptodactylus fuscus]|uniref:protein NPAT isoform X2 n=1 Tax=Leptodactylus fuscus TaxID=238119 RepID=UPI003F4E6363
MLLPSDIARLVLGYLQQEKLTSTCQSFIAESPNLKEYAEHHTEDGNIPGCLLSLFGKNLTTILNEYITMKAKENEAEVPFMMSSLWKKLDVTLSQIRSMQESSAFNNNQRGSPTSHPVIHQTSTPIMATQYILRPLHPPGALQPITSSSFGGESIVQNSNSTSISIEEPAQSSSSICTQRKPAPTATASPMRRKQDIQRRRRAAPMSATAVTLDGAMTEDVDTLQAIIDNDFPQMVIENAREKILSNKSLQEKLAENINKFLGSESAAQSTKQADGATAEQDTSIDEILGLQGGEIHMSEEAIHDILTQTELDPDFQELYDLFACVTSKAPKVATRESTSSNIDPKNVTEKGKRPEAVERVLDAEDSTEGPKKSEVPSKGKESISPGKSLEDQTSQSPCTSQQASANEKSTLENQTSSCDDQNSVFAPTESPECEIVMDTSTDLPGMDAVDSSREQDTEIKNLSPSKDVSTCASQAAEKSSPPKTDGSMSIGTESPRTVNKEPKDIASTEVTIDVTPSDTNKSEPVTPPSSKALGTPRKEKNGQATISSKQSPSSHPCHVSTQHVNVAEMVASKERTPPSAAVHIEFPAQVVVASETATPCSSVPIPSQTIMEDSSIVMLNILTEDLSDDTELHNAVDSIHAENYAAIILSPVVKSQKAIPIQDNAIIDLTDSPLAATQSSDGSVSVNALSGDCTVYSVSGPSNSSAESGIIQIVPVTSSTFTPSGNIYINSGSAMPSNIVMLSNSSASSQKQPGIFQTPPRPGSVYTVGQTVSPKLSQGSTIILASPVQPVLQGVMGMFPVSLVGQSGSTFNAPSHQLLHVPVSKPIIPKLPLPRSQKLAPVKTSANPGKPLSSSAADPSSGSSSLVVQRLGNEGKKSESEPLNKANDTAPPDSANAPSKEAEAHRRVLCFDGALSAKSKLASPSCSNSKSPRTDRHEAVPNVASSLGSVSSSRSNLPKENKKNENVAPPPVVKNPKAATASAKDQPAEQRPVTSSGGTLGNKENVLQVETGHQRPMQAEKRSNAQESEKNAKRPQETSKKPTSLPNILRRTPQKVASERVCPTSPLVKQASHLLQDMHFQSPPSKQSSQGDLPIPSTPGIGLEEKPSDTQGDQARTPTCKRYNEDGGTPKPMFPPATPELPTCSPASEAGSENSVNMAAHTLMILSRASLAKSTGNTPLKDNTQQIKSCKSASKKRKLEDTEEFQRPTNKKEQISPSSSQKKKRAKKNRKKSMDSFPAGMDVDKFLMSLHYDE